MRLGKTLSSTLDLDELLKKALELLKERWGYAVCGILLPGSGKRMNSISSRSLAGILKESKKCGLGSGIDGIVGWVAKTGEPFYVPDVSKDPRYIPGISHREIRGGLSAKGEGSGDRGFGY